MTNFLKNNIAPQLRYIEGASIERTPTMLVKPIEKLIQPIMEGIHFILRPQWTYNYGQIEVVNGYKTASEGLFVGHGLNLDEYNKVYVLSFPGFERSNILLHVNIAHEIGHCFQEEYVNLDQFVSKAELREELKESFGSKKGLSLLRPLSKIIGETNSFCKNAITEFLADLFSLRLFGPAAIFALHEVALLSKSMDQIRGEHPPWRTRLRLLLKELDWSKWCDALKKSLPKLGDFPEAGIIVDSVDERVSQLLELVKDTTDEDVISKSDATRIAYSHALKNIPKLRSLLERPGFSQFGPELCDQTLRLTQLLANKIPPNEYFTKDSFGIADLRCILNAGWFYRIAHVSEMSSGECEAHYQQFDLLNRLLLKAIELSSIHSEYVEWKEGELAGNEHSIQ